MPRLPVEESYVNRRFGWYKRWRLALVASTILVWLPVVVLLFWKLQVVSVLKAHGFYWLPGLDNPDLTLWDRFLLKLSYNLEYYAQIFRRLIAIGVAIGLATAYRLVAAGKHSELGVVYRDYRHAVRRAIYWAMLVFLLLPAMVSELSRDARISTEGLDIGLISFPLFLAAADWFSQCEFQQWLILKFPRLGARWYFTLTLLLTAMYFCANYYFPQISRWDQSNFTNYYAYVVSAFLIGFSIVTGLFWRHSTKTAGKEMHERAKAAISTADQLTEAKRKNL